VGSSQSAIDNVISNVGSYLDINIINTAISDHLGQEIYYKNNSVEFKSSSMIKKRTTAPLNIDSFKSLLCLEIWNDTRKKQD